LSREYKKQFWTHKVKTIIIPYVISYLVYALLYVATGYTRKLNLVTNLLTGSPAVLFSWYIIALLLMYLFFYVSWSDSLNLVRFIILGGIYVFVTAIVLRYPTNWYGTIIAFYIGALIRLYSDKLKVKYNVAVYIILSAILIICYWQTIDYSKTIKWLSLEIIATIALSILLFLFSSKIRFRDKNVLHRINKYGLEIYLYHGIFITAFTMVNVKNGFFVYLAPIVCVTGCLIFGVIMHWVDGKVVKLIFDRK